MSEKKKLSAFVSQKARELKTYWKKAPEGKYVPFKEIAAYSVGGAGVYFIFSLVGQIALNAGSMIVGASIGIEAIDLQTMNALSIILSFLIAPARAMMFDNTRSKMGKFRPYILYLGLPTALSAIAFVYMPYETMEYSQKCVTVFVFYTLLQFFSPFYQSAYASLVQVLSPNSAERGWIIEISSIVYSFAPTVINPVLPLIGNLEDIETYRISFPIFCVIGLIVSMFCVFGTEERIIVPKNYVQKVGFIEGFKKVSKNKYFWIINSSSWLSFLANGSSYIFQWIFYYGMNNPSLYALMVVIKGEASTPGMALAAPLMNKFGKKRICLFSLTAQAFCLLMMLACYKNFILVFVFIFLKDMVGALSIIYIPAMNADMMDYQQYKTGDRLEGFIGQTGTLLTSAISLVTGYAIPVILKNLGLTNNYNDLYNGDFRNPIVKAIIIYSVIGTLMSLIPYIFYDLDEKKRSNMIKVLKIRALFEDHLNGELSEESLKDTMKDIIEAEEILKNEKDYDTGFVSGARLTMNEVYKFSSDEYIRKIKLAKELTAKGINSLCEFDKSVLTAAKAMPEGTKEEKKMRKEAIAYAKSLERSARLISSYYPDGITVPDSKSLTEASLMSENTAAEKKAKKQAVKRAEKELKMYGIAAKPFVEAELLLKREKAYGDFEILKERYLTAVAAE